MKLRHLILIVAALLLQEPASDGARWWRHIEFLASDALEGRSVGTPGFEKAAAYVEAQFKDIGLKPGGTAGYCQPVKFESRLLVAADSQLTLMRDGQELPLAIPADASLTARGELSGSIDAPMTFIGYGLSIPEAGCAGRHSRQRPLACHVDRRTLGGSQESRRDRYRNDRAPTAGRESRERHAAR